MATYRIYSLSDPRDGLVRYVGRTRNPIEVRFKQHWERGGKHQTLGPWFAELQSIGMQPIVGLLQEHNHPYAEWYWAHELRKQGHPIFGKHQIQDFLWPTLEDAVLAYPEGCKTSYVSVKAWKLANKESVAKQQASYHRRNRSKRTSYMRRYMADRRKHPTEPDPWLSM